MKKGILVIALLFSFSFTNYSRVNEKVEKFNSYKNNLAFTFVNQSEYSCFEITHNCIIDTFCQKEIEPDTSSIVCESEIMPRFPGGEEALIKYLYDNKVYPELAIKIGVEGRVVATFSVDEMGKISEVAVVKGIGAGCDEEVIRLLKSMPNWRPGRAYGVPIKIRMHIPVTFNLSEIKKK